MQTAQYLKQCSNYVEFNALFSFTMLANLPATWCSFEIEKYKTKLWISSRSWKIL